jgi:carboxynorspermidine decarboxylase
MVYSEKIPYDTVPCPAFVLDLERLKSNLQLISKVQESAGVHIILALKAFANWKTFPLIGSYLKGATASSLNEARLINEEMGCKAHSYFVAYKQEEFEQVLKLSSHLTFNSIEQYLRFKNQINESGNPVSVGIRINPEYSSVDTDLYNPSSPGSRLGLPAEAFQSGWPEGVDGIHFHTLCESNSYDLEKTLQVIEEKFGAHLHRLKWINMGGGHGMTSKDYDTEHLIQLLTAFRTKYNLDIILEPGSAIAWQTGELVAEVLDIHEAKDIKTLILDVSFTAHMPDTLEMPYQPHIKGQVKASDAAFNYRIGGLSCLAGDFLKDYWFDKPITIGQRIVFGDMMHYTTVKTTMFNGIGHPSILHWDGKHIDAIKSFGYLDYKNRMA